METPTTSPKTTFLGNAHHPFLQAAVAGGMMIIFLLASRLMSTLGPHGFGDRLPWIVALAFLLLFSVFNSIFCLASVQAERYWRRSIIAYLGLGGLGILLAWLLTGRFFTEVGSFKWMYIVVTFCYLVFISIINFMRNIVDLAQKEEWDQPRLKSRKRGY